MSLIFPVGPSLEQTYTHEDITYSFDGIKWTSVRRHITNVFTSVDEMVSHIALSAGDWVKVITPSSEYVVARSGDVLLDNGLYANLTIDYDIYSIARSKGVSNNSVIRVSDVSHVLDDVLYVYDMDSQVTYRKPLNIAAGSTLTTSPYTLWHSDTSGNSNSYVYGLATLTNSTNNIHLEGVGLLKGLEVGDIVKVSGSASNNTEFTVESIVDADNIVVNYEHRGSNTSKSLVTEISKYGVTVELLCKYYSAAPGVGQGWCTPTTVRVVDEDYTNNTNKPISIAVSVMGVTAIANLELYIDGAQIIKSRTNEDSSTSTTYSSITISIPAGSVYKVVTDGYGILTNWVELR